MTAKATKPQNKKQTSKVATSKTVAETPKKPTAKTPGEQKKELLAKTKVPKKAVAEKVKAVRIRVEPPPRPQVRIGDEINPINESKHLKRALCVALAMEIEKGGNNPEEHVTELANICRMIGVVKRLGFGEKNPDSEDLANNELSGIGYAKRTAIAFWKDGYQTQFPDKVGACANFAHAAVRHYHPQLAAKQKKA